MAKRVVIVGDVTGRPARKSVLDALSARRSDVTWEWLQAVGPGFNIPPKYFGSLLHEMRQKGDAQAEKPTVVKLEHLHGKDANELLRVCADPVRAPLGLDTAEHLVEWLLSDDASLFREPPWRETVRQVSLVAILAKLLRNKSWNKDKHGHQWTKEDDLLGQAPVARSDLPALYTEATELIETAKNSLLITKGGKQGKTPKEWCINTAFLPAVKRSITSRSLAPLRAEAGLNALMQRVDEGAATMEKIEIDDSIVSEKVLSVCRDRLRSS